MAKVEMFLDGKTQILYKEDDVKNSMQEFKNVCKTHSEDLGWVADAVEQTFLNLLNR